MKTGAKFNHDTCESANEGLRPEPQKQKYGVRTECLQIIFAMKRRLVVVKIVISDIERLRKERIFYGVLIPGNGLHGRRQGFILYNELTREFTRPPGIALATNIPFLFRNAMIRC